MTCHAHICAWVHDMPNTNKNFGTALYQLFANCDKCEKHSFLRTTTSNRNKSPSGLPEGKRKTCEHQFLGEDEVQIWVFLVWETYVGKRPPRLDYQIEGCQSQVPHVSSPTLTLVPFFYVLFEEWTENRDRFQFSWSRPRLCPGSEQSFVAPSFSLLDPELQSESESWYWCSRYFETESDRHSLSRNQRSSAQGNCRCDVPLHFVLVVNQKMQPNCRIHNLVLPKTHHVNQLSKLYLNLKLRYSL